MDAGIEAKAYGDLSEPGPHRRLEKVVATRLGGGGAQHLVGTIRLSVLL